MKITSLLLVFGLLLVSCGDDDAVPTTASADSAGSESVALTDAEREWCTFPDASETSAYRFDLIFEAGLALNLPVDAMNAQAAGLRDQFLAEGMDIDAATRAVSEALLEEQAFIAACKEAYATNNPSDG